MAAIKLRGFKIFKDRHGKPRAYHRKTGAAVDIAKFPIGSAEFFAECQRIAALSTKSRVEVRPGTLGLLINKYRASSAFLDLAPRTQADYQKHFDYLKPISDVALTAFDKPLVVRIREKAAQKHGRRFGNYLKATLSVIFGWGSERGYISSNPASGIKALPRPKNAPRANRPWSDQERHAVLDAAPPHLKPAIAIMMFTGLGPKDALTLRRSQYNDGAISTQRAKTGEPVFWPAPKMLEQILKNAPTHSATTLCASSSGRPWTLDGFRTSWGRVRDDLEKTGAVRPGLTLYGLRHTVAVVLREAGHDERTIADALGQKTIEMARHYSAGADLVEKMTLVSKSFDAEMSKRGTKVSNLTKKSVKP